jgi:RNA polymerase sigma-70 factor (ECF subfamily)
MLSSIQQAERVGYGVFFSEGIVSRTEQCREAYERNRHRVYALSFWMMGSEPAAEDVMTTVFSSVFAFNCSPTTEEIDETLVCELRKKFVIPTFTLDCAASTQVRAVRENTLRVELERAVIDLPATEKLIFALHDIEGYDHNRIAPLLGITERESRLGLHQARLRLRELLAQ